MSASIFYGHVDFPLLLILGETLIARFFAKRSHFCIRYVLYVLLTIGSNFGLYYLENAVNNMFYNISVPFIVFLISLLGLFFCFRASFASYLLAANIGYCLQNTSYCLASLVRMIFGFDANEKWYFMMAILIPIFSLYTYFFNKFYLSKPENVKGIGQITEKRQIIITFISCAAISFLSSCGMLTAMRADNDAVGWISIYCFNICIGVISITSELELLTSRAKIKEAAQIKARYDKDKEAYRQNTENIELINIRMHDLKHQMDSLTNKLGEEEIESLKKSIDGFCQKVKTNCAALDFVLQEKGATLLNNKIQLTCMLNGEKLNFIPREVLYSLFENALSNSIEAVKELPVEKRLISIKGIDLGDYMHIHIENYSPNQKSISLGETSKKDKIGHGYGLKSIKNIMEEYNGKFSYRLEDGIFSLDLFFYLQNQSRKDGIVQEIL